MDSVQCYSFTLGPLRCLFTTRAAGSFTFARAIKTEVLANYRQLEKATGIPSTRIVRIHLDNGVRVVGVGSKNAGQGITRELGVLDKADALHTNTLGLYLGITTADCFPLVLHDPANKAIGLAHCGWRGIAGRLDKKLLEAMAEDYGTIAKDVVAIIGPGIRGCCYLQQDDVLKEVFAEYDNLGLVKTLPGGDYTIDIALALRANMAALGINKVVDTKICTGCNPQFFSARREGFATGRGLALVSLQD